MKILNSAAGSVKGAFDSVLKRNGSLSWRRLMAFCFACGLLYTGQLGEDTWLWVTMAYIGAEGAQRIADSIAGK